MTDRPVERDVEALALLKKCRHAEQNFIVFCSVCVAAALRSEREARDRLSRRVEELEKALTEIVETNGRGEYWPDEMPSVLSTIARRALSGAGAEEKPNE